MSDQKDFAAGVGSDQRKAPVRVAFITRRTSAQVKAHDEPIVQSFPEVLFRAAIAVEVLTSILVVISLFFNAPLEGLADPSHTPNPAKAPWYFLGLQELLHYFPPFVAGILIPTLVVLALVVIPYFNVNVEGEPIWAKNHARDFRVFLSVLAVLTVFLAAFRAWTVLVPTIAIGGLVVWSYFAVPAQSRFHGYLHNRALSWWVMTWFIAVSVVLTVVGTFFRGPGWSWVWPWRGHAG